MSPDTNDPGSQAALCRSSPNRTHMPGVPVAHLGCPMDHIWHLAKQSPGDL